VKMLLAGRESVVSAYEQAISLLQEGRDQNWTRNQYFAALSSKPNSLPFYSMRRTLDANPNFDQAPGSLKLAMQDLLEYFTRNLALRRKAKPPGSAPTSS
jgi:hypothetical protein